MFAEVFEPAWDAATNDDVFRLRICDLSRALACGSLEVIRYDLAPGGVLAPIPARSVEQVVLVLAGRATVRGTGGDHELESGQAACVSLHIGSLSIENRTADVVRLLTLSARLPALPTDRPAALDP